MIAINIIIELQPGNIIEYGREKIDETGEHVKDSCDCYPWY